MGLFFPGEPIYALLLPREHDRACTRRGTLVPLKLDCQPGFEAAPEFLLSRKS